MDPDYDIHLNDENETAADAAAADLAKSHFLDSIGIRGDAEAREKADSEDEQGNPEGLVLSSMPDDLGFPTAEISSRGWDFPGIDLEPASRLSPDAISLPEQENPPHPDPKEGENTAHAEADPDETLNLHCPSCRGALVLKRRHLGIEGACVWCHTSIVAAESPQDRSVRIFPISPAAPNEPAVEPDKTTTIEPAPAEPAPAAPAAPAALVETESTDTVTEDASTDEGFGAGFSSWTAPPRQDAAEATETAEIAEMPDLDALYETSGFLTPSVPPADSAPLPSGFGETLAAPATAEETETETTLPSGFGAFLQSPASKTNAEAEPDFGFAAPVPWGPPPMKPVPEAPAETVAERDEPPMALEDAGARDDFSSPWGTSMAGPGCEVSSGSFGADLLSDDFTPPPSSEIHAGDPPSDYSFANFPEEGKPTELASDDFERSYAPPLHEFSTGSSKEASPIAMESGLSGLTSVPALAWSQAGDETPAALKPIAEEPLFRSDGVAEMDATPFEGANSAGASLFGGMRSEVPASPFAPLPQPVQTPGAPAVEAPLEVPSSTTAPPPIPTAPASLDPTPAPLFPQVVSQPLGAKEKPQVRKGFLVLMVVIVGFASGAALASFVLPVEEYVASARAFMEEKFNPGSNGHQMPALPSLVGSEEASHDFRP